MDATLAALIVHDIKNALGVLEGQLHEMTLAPAREQAELARDTCAALRERLIGFLTLYKASSQGLHARIDALAPQDFLGALVRNRPAGRPELSITIATHGMPVLGFFDENLAGLALEAALQNAARFARSAIELGCVLEEDGTLAFTIRDDGEGLKAKESTPSTGLGMALCSAVAQAHCRNGKQGLASLEDHPGGGALFTLRLP